MMIDTMLAMRMIMKIDSDKDGNGDDGDDEE